MAVLAVEGRAALGVMSGQRREPALDRRDRVRLAISRSRAAGAGGDVEPDCQRGGRERLGTLTTAPARKQLLVRGVGPPRVSSAGHQPQPRRWRRRRCRARLSAGRAGAPRDPDYGTSPQTASSQRRRPAACWPRSRPQNSRGPARRGVRDARAEEVRSSSLAPKFAAANFFRFPKCRRTGLLRYNSATTRVGFFAVSRSERSRLPFVMSPPPTD